MVFSPSEQKSLSNLVSVMIMFLLQTNGSGVQWVNAAYAGGKGGPFMVTVTVFL
jgi:hypothetical protein